MFYKRIRKRLKKTAFTCVIATALTVTSVCTDGFGVAVHEMVKTEAATEDGFIIEDGVLTGYDYSTLGKDVVIPDSVTVIGDSAFEGNSNIETVAFSDTVQEIKSDAFKDCKNLKIVKMGTGVTDIGRSAFSGCTALSSISIPTSVTSIKGDAFCDTPWLETQISNSPNRLVCVNDILIDGTRAVGSVQIPFGVREIAEYAFKNSDAFQVIIPNTVISIENFAFQLSGIASLKIPDSVVSIGEYAFIYCTRLREVEVGTGVTTLRQAMFYQCTKLEEVSLPDGIVSIADSTFDGCNNLYYVSMPKKLKTIGSMAFNQCTRLKEVVLPGSLENIGKGAFSNCTNLKSLSVPISVKRIDGPLYEQCPNLVIKGVKGSYIESYVKNYSYMVFIPVESVAEPTEKPKEIPMATATPKPTGKPIQTATPIVTPLTQYTVNFDAAGGTVTPASKLVAHGATYGTLPIPEKTGYKFLWWCTGNAEIGGVVITSESKVFLSEDHTLYAQWVLDQYEVTLDAQGGTLSSDKMSVSYGEMYGNLPIPTKKNKSFDGWYTKDGKLITNETSCTITNNHTLYAKWVEPYRAADVSTLSYNFGNCSTSFSYPDGYKLPLSAYHYVFGDSVLAQEIYESHEKWGGSCFGMSSSSVLLYAGTTDLKFKDFNGSAKATRDLRPADYNKKIDLTLLRVIEALQVSCSTPSIQKALTYNSDINELCQKVKEAQNGKGLPVVIVMSGPDGGAHTVVGYKLKGEKLYIYDPNFPEKKRIITVKKDSSGKYVSWEYNVNDASLWGTGQEKSNICYVPYELYKNIWEQRDDGRHANTNWLTLSTENASIYDVEGNKVAEIIHGKLKTDRKDVYVLQDITAEPRKKKGVSLYLPSDVYKIVNTDKNQQEFTMDMVHVNQGASVTTEADEIIVAVNDQERINSVVCNAGEGVSYKISLMSTFEDDEENVEVSGTGTSVGKVGISQSMGNVQLTNCTLVNSSADKQKKTSHMISFESSQGGTVSFCGGEATATGTQSIVEGDSATYVMVPEDGYIVSDVIVDGNSVGAVPMFSFSDIKEAHHIAAVFAKVDVSTLTVDAIGSQKHTGKEVEPVVTVRMGDKVLTENADYGVVYSNNKNVGIAKVMIVGFESYIGFEKTVSFTITASKGEIYTVGDMKYQVIDSKKKTVTFVSPVSKKKTSVTIPKTVKIGTATYKVTKIAAKAFNGCSKLKKITIKSTYLTSVGAQAFKGISPKAVIKVPTSKLSKYKKLLKNKGQKKTVKIKK